jgi:hypothetical protein
MRYCPPSAVTTPVPHDTDAPLCPTVRFAVKDAFGVAVTFALPIQPPTVPSLGDVRSEYAEHVSSIMNRSPKRRSWPRMPLNAHV